MPDEDALAAPSDDYFEIECAKVHGGWPAWSALPTPLRGWLMAHELEKNMRDYYHYEVRDKKSAAGADKPPARDVAALIRERWQGRPDNIADQKL